MIAISSRTVVAGEHLALVGGGLHDGAAPGCPPLVHPPVRLDMPQPRAVHLHNHREVTQSVTQLPKPKPMPSALLAIPVLRYRCASRSAGRMHRSSQRMQSLARHSTDVAFRCGRTCSMESSAMSWVRMVGVEPRKPLSLTSSTVSPIASTCGCASHQHVRTSDGIVQAWSPGSRCL